MFIHDEITEKFVKLQEILKPTVSIEVGSYDADFSKKMSFLSKKCFAFEASPFVYAKFKDSMGGIDYINKAVSNVDGSIKFEIQSHLNPSEVGNNSIKNRNEDLNYAYIDVDSVSLDSFFSNLNENIVLWIDCEGASEEVLTGAESLLINVSSIFIETETKEFWKKCWFEQDVIDYLKGFGFELLYKSFAYENQNNCIFVKNNLISQEILNIFQENSI
jgi:FkbM family methyltransferase